MSLNQTPSGERTHIGIFGKRNSGKSSLINAVTGQKLAIVSDVAGTTTDPVYKAMEILPLGPVMLIDTPGLDDEGALGEMRVEKAKQVLSKIHIAIVCADIRDELGNYEKELIASLKERGIPFALCYTKKGLYGGEREKLFENQLAVSSVTGENINELRELLGNMKPNAEEKYLVRDLISPGDTVVLVIPIDESAPKGRLILPQQQTIRDILDAGAYSYVTGVEELPFAIANMKKKPALVITDSQAFGRVNKLLPEDIPLTSFSVLFARYKGSLETMAGGAFYAEKLKDGDKVLISEGCTHHRQCGDIGTVKLPGWLSEFTGKKLSFSFTSGGEFPESLKEYSLIIHCGGCTLNEAEMKHRIKKAKAEGVPITNYGMMIAHVNGILKKSLKPLKK